MKKVHRDLKAAIQYVNENRINYVNNPCTDFTRNRKLTFEDTIRLILSMEGGSLQKELYEFSKQSKIVTTASSFVQQRSKISSNAFKDVFLQFNTMSRDRKLHKGYRIFAVDGSDINHYRNPDSESFVSNAANLHGYNQTHLNAIYDICNRTYYDVFLQPRLKANERSAVIEMLHRNLFKEKSIIIADRGYEGYNMFAHFINTDNVDFVCRVRNGVAGLKEVQALPMKECDVDVQIEITTTQTNEDKKHKRTYIQTHTKKDKTYSLNTRHRAWDFPSPYTLKFRIVRFQLDTGEYETLATSLNRKEFSINDLKELYHMRWGIETSFRELKYVTGLINFHAKKEDLVYQEIYATLIMYNYCSRMANCSSVQKQQKTKYSYKMNFTMTAHICRMFFKTNGMSFSELLWAISRYVEPIRPGRQDQRNLRPKGFVGFVYRVAA